MKKAIITYFEPFGGRKINASKEVALSLANDFEKIELPVSWQRSAPIIRDIIKEEPQYLFMLGEANTYQDVVIELTAHNIMSGTDEDGVKKSKDKILDGTSKVLQTNFKFGPIDAYTSNDAGKFLCNYVYYLALLESEITKVIFLHIPSLHVKGQRKKQLIVDKVTAIIDEIMDRDHDFLVRLNNRVVEINKDNVSEYLPALTKEYDLPNIIVKVDRESDGSFMMIARMDGSRKKFYGHGKSKIEEEDIRKELIYRVALYLLKEPKNEEEEIENQEITFRYEINEFYGEEKEIKRYLICFLSRADYTDEMSFYRSIERVDESLRKSVHDDEEFKVLITSKEYIKRLGLEKSKELLFRLVK